MSEEAEYQFGREMAEILHIIVRPLWWRRGQLDRAIAGGLVAFERGFFDGVRIVYDWTSKPRQSSEFADWEGMWQQES